MRSQWAGGRGLRWNLQQTLTPAFLCQLCDAHKVPRGWGFTVQGDLGQVMAPGWGLRPAA